jgi:hypothetical protein
MKKLRFSTKMFLLTPLILSLGFLGMYFFRGHPEFLFIGAVGACTLLAGLITKDEEKHSQKGKDET